MPITELGNFYPLPVLFFGRHFRSGNFYRFYFSERQLRICNKLPVTGFIPQNLIGNHFCQGGRASQCCLLFPPARRVRRRTIARLWSIPRSIRKAQWLLFKLSSDVFFIRRLHRFGVGQAAGCSSHLRASYPCESVHFGSRQLWSPAPNDRASREGIDCFSTDTWSSLGPSWTHVWNR